MEGEVRFKSPFRINQQLVNNELCIIRQSSDTEDLKSTENGQRRVIDAVSKKLGIVWERLKNYGDQPFKYHVNNTCYKSYTHIKSLKKLQVRKLYSKIKTIIKFPYLCVFNSKISAIEFSFSVCRFVTDRSSIFIG